MNSLHKGQFSLPRHLLFVLCDVIDFYLLEKNTPISIEFSFFFSVNHVSGFFLGDAIPISSSPRHHGKRSFRRWRFRPPSPLHSLLCHPPSTRRNNTVTTNPPLIPAAVPSRYVYFVSPFEHHRDDIGAGSAFSNNGFGRQQTLPMWR